MPKHTNKLTNLQVKNARARSKPYFLSDGDRLYLRVRPERNKQWVFIYRFDGRRRTKGLGIYPKVTILAARELAELSRKQVAGGIDPVDAKKQAATDRKAEKKKQEEAEKQMQEASLTVRQLFDEWKKRILAHRKDKGASILRSFTKDVFETIGDLSAVEIKKREIVIILNTVTDRGVSRTAKVLLGDLRQMFTYAANQDYIAKDPTLGLRKIDYGGPSKPRERTLAAKEIQELVAMLRVSDLNPVYQRAVWIMLATMCRVGELSKAKWNEIDLEKGEWKIPAENAKNGREHIVHLSPFAIQHFRALTRRKGRGWVLPAQDGKSHLSEKVINKQLQDRQRGHQIEGRSKQGTALQLPGGKWTPHDLRRTGSTLMGDLNVRPDVINRCQNHVLSDKITQTYQRQELLKERREAFETLGKYLSTLTDDEA